MYGVGMRRLLAVLGLCAASMSACMPPQMPSDKLTDAAYSIVEAARFGRMDIVLNNVHPAKQGAYADAHAEWGGDVRILDIEYGGARILTPEKAIVMMTVAWQRIDESTLRSTALKQTWRLGGERWAIDEEIVASGDARLLKEPEPEDKSKDNADPTRIGAASAGPALVGAGSDDLRSDDTGSRVSGARADGHSGF